jgi:GNAT superfamily N-acetyltransferase
MQSQNIFNLTELWKLGGLLSGKLISEKGVFASMGTAGDWPNKLWMEGTPSSEKMKKAGSIGKDKSLSLALWEEEVSEDLIAEIGFRPTFELIGMSCDLASLSPFSSPIIELQLVKNPSQASIWSLVFFDAFGYEIPPSTVLALGEKVSFYTAWLEEHPIGTSMIFKDSRGVAGVYSIGVAPSFRGKGLAKPLFESTLSQLKKAGSNTAVLQASAMGLGLYLKYGFQSDFKIRFYKN